MRVLIVDDHPAFCEVMALYVSSVFPDAVIHAEHSLEAAIERAREIESLDHVFLDLGLGDCHGLRSLERFREQFPQVPVTIVSVTEDGPVIRAALRAGARGYIPKTASPKIIRVALLLVAAGGIFIPPQALQDVSDTSSGPPRSGDGELSGRQLDVLRALSKGLRNREIAHELNIAENTVKQHVHKVYQTLGVSNRSDAKNVAARKGISTD